MKNLIVVIALLIYMGTVITFQIDLNKNIKYIWLLKDIVDDCTVAATLLIDSKKYSEGLIVFDYANSIKLVNELLDYNTNEEDYSYYITFADHSGNETTYDDKLNKISTTSYDENNPTVKIELTGKSPEFRLEFINIMEKITVYSTYEYVGY